MNKLKLWNIITFVGMLFFGILATILYIFGAKDGSYFALILGCDFGTATIILSIIYLVKEKYKKESKQFAITAIATSILYYIIAMIIMMTMLPMTITYGV